MTKRNLKLKDIAVVIMPQPNTYMHIIDYICQMTVKELAISAEGNYIVKVV